MHKNNIENNDYKIYEREIRKLIQDLSKYINTDRLLNRHYIKSGLKRLTELRSLIIITDNTLGELINKFLCCYTPHYHEILFYKELVNDSLFKSIDLLIKNKATLKDINEKYSTNEINYFISYLVYNLTSNNNAFFLKHETIVSALISGFEENFIVSSYIIPAQIEFLLKGILEKHNVYRMKMSFKHGDFTAEDESINQFLTKDKYLKVILKQKYLNQDIINEIKDILICKHNLRNNIYHGFINDSNFIEQQDIHYKLWIIFLEIIINMYKGNTNE